MRSGFIGCALTIRLTRCDLPRNLIWNVGINEHTNFNNFGNALLLLIRVATLDNWWDIMTDTIATPENSQCTKVRHAGEPRRGASQVAPCLHTAGLVLFRQAILPASHAYLTAVSYTCL